MFLQKLLHLKTKTPKGKTVSCNIDQAPNCKVRGKKIKKGEKPMDEEIKTEEKKETEPVKETEKVETTEKPKEEVVETKIENVQEPAQNDPLIGVRVEDIVTKNDLSNALASLSAKLDAVLKENEDLKSKMTELKGENDGLKQKYEENDFGNVSKQGFEGKQNAGYESYDDYFKKF